MTLPKLQSNHIDIGLKKEMFCYKTINEIDGVKWNKIQEQQPFLSFHFLRVLEKSLNDFDFRYFIFKDGDKIIGKAYFQLFTIKGTGIRLSQNEYLKNNVKNCIVAYTKLKFRQWFSKKSLFMILNGNIFLSWAEGFEFSPNISEERQLKLLKNAVDQIKQDQSKNLLGLTMFKDFEIESSFVSRLEQEKYKKVITLPEMVMNLRPHWQSFDDYLGDMKSKYRVRVKSALKKADRLITEDLGVEGVRQYEDDIYRLYRSIADNVDFNLAYLSKTYFSDLKKQFPDQFYIQGYFQDEKLVGMISYFVIGKALSAHYCGYESSVNGTFKLYQKILYDLVKISIQKKVSVLNFGRTAMEIKSTVGAVAQPVTCMVKMSNPVYSNVLQSVFRYTQQSEWTPRMPFKQEYY